MIRRRLIDLVMGSAFLGLFLGIFYLTILQGARFRDLSRKNCIRLLPQEGTRGKIYDTNGSVIVGNEICYDLMVLPQQDGQIDDILMGVAKVLGRDFKDLKSEFRKEFVSVSLPVPVVRDIDVRSAVILEELKPELGNIIIHPRAQRDYPYGRIASHIIGYLNEIDHWRLTKLQDYGYNTKDIVGFGGLEERYDYYLRQEEGGLLFEVDHRGRFVSILGFKGPRNGKDIQLTIDLKIQKIVEDAIGNRIGSVVIMEPYTGEIIAMASYPNFNPEVFIKKSAPAINNILNNRSSPLLNRAISGVYPPGSVFKVVTAAAAIETGKITSATTVTCSGGLEIGDRIFDCWKTHSNQNLKEAIANSCNSFFYHIGLLTGPNSIHDYAQKFGLGKVSGIDIPYEEEGFVPSPIWMKIYRFKNWFNGDTANFAIGQGDLLVTPLQIARMMAVFVNKGYLVNPYLVKGVDNREIHHRPRKNPKLPLKESTIFYIRDGLRRTVTSETGTAHILNVLTVSVAGKTGTAQAPPSQPHGWFAGFFPFDQPRYVICVFLEHGGAGSVACGLAKDIIEKMIEGGLL